MIQNDSPAILWEMHSLLDKAEQNLLFMNRMQQWGQNAPNFHQLFFLDIQLRYNDFSERTGIAKMGEGVVALTMPWLIFVDLT